MKNLLTHILFLIFVSQVSALGVDEYLQKNLSGYKYFTYEVTKLPSRIESIDDPRVIFDNERELKVRKGYAYLPIKISHDSDRELKSTITLKVKLFQDVLVAKRKIIRGEEISIADFVFVEKEISKLRSEPITNYNLLNGAIAKSVIKENSIVDLNMLDRKPAIEHGDRVSAKFTVGTVEVSFFVTAREKGSIGDKIKVVRDDKKMFRASIINNENVKIIE